MISQFLRATSLFYTILLTPPFYGKIESLPLLGKFEKLNPVSSFIKEWWGVGGVGPGDPTMRYDLIF